MKPTKDSNRQKVLKAMAARHSLSVDDWTWSLQQQEIKQLREEDIDAYIDLLETVAFAVESPSGRTPPPPKVCDQCGLERHPNQFPAGGDTCKRCQARQAKANAPVIPKQTPENAKREAALLNERRGRRAAI